MTEKELANSIDRMHKLVSEAREMMNNTGDYESDYLDGIACRMQDVTEGLEYFKKYVLADAS